MSFARHRFVCFMTIGSPKQARGKFAPPPPYPRDRRERPIPWQPIPSLQRDALLKEARRAMLERRRSRSDVPIVSLTD